MLSTKDLRNKSLSNLEKQAADIRKQISAVKLERIQTEEKNLKKMKNLRKDLARVLTIMNEPVAVVEADEAKETK